ncbi:putative addiction module component [Aquimarina sp. MAR_2010_214]|uniref:addiction module protein n=1 Tax=Aquimarina sp. MAR_2010_214 TaxID=1250026 RepID=UPI000C6FD985|nr:addiction module protein [Aquimarina sp. MAR_2010_214]PKV50816.1 putative addiction module component [Aquimarina sp. MAR_2010_214]
MSNEGILMGLEYITDENGLTKEVRIPIEDWNALTEKYQGIEEEVYEIPEWQKEEVRKRLKNIEEGKEQLLDGPTVLDELEARF